MRPGSFEAAAAVIGCETAVIKAIFEVEAAGSGFWKDGTLKRRFEPHKMPRSMWAGLGFHPGGAAPWRASLKIKQAAREDMLRQAYEIDPEAACRATSAGGPQIMGFNHDAAGFQSAIDMFQAMADSETAQLDAFVALITSWGLDGAMRAHDFQTIEDRYNGGGFDGEYARKMEAAYRRHSGKSSPVVLRIGSKGAEVKALQKELRIEADGSFGTETDAAVRAFQEAEGLPVDGVVGKRTWGALRVSTKAQPTPVDALIETGKDWATKAGGGFTVGAAAGEMIERAPDGAVNMLWYGGSGLVLLALVLAGFVVFRHVVSRT